MKSFVTHLQDELVERCRKNSRYSLRSFARSLGVNHGILSMVLRGKRPLTSQMIQSMGLALGLDKKMLESYLRALDSDATGYKRGAGKKSEQIKKINQLTIDVFNVVSDWYHDAILELSRTRGFTGTPQYISRRLGITVTEARIAIERLLRVGLIEIAENGTWRETLGDNSTTTQVDFTNPGLKNLQKQVLALSLRALETQPKGVRDHTCLTVAMNAHDLPEAKRIIKNFRLELMSFLQREKSDFDEVYQLAVSLYPLTVSVKPKNQGESI